MHGGHLPSHPPCKEELAFQWGPPPAYLLASPAIVSLISNKQLPFLHLPQPPPNLWTRFYRPGRSQGPLDTTDARTNRVDLMSICPPLSASPSSLFTKSAHFYCNAHATDVASVVQEMKCSSSLSAPFCMLVLQADTSPSSAVVPGPLASLKSTLHGIYGSMWFMVIFFLQGKPSLIPSQTKLFHAREDTHVCTQDH